MEFAITATAYVSVGFSGSLLQMKVSPMVGVQNCLGDVVSSYTAVYNVRLYGSRNACVVLIVGRGIVYEYDYVHSPTTKLETAVTVIWYPPMI